MEVLQAQRLNFAHQKGWCFRTGASEEYAGGNAAARYMTASFPAVLPATRRERVHCVDCFSLEQRWNNIIATASHTSRHKSKRVFTDTTRRYDKKVVLSSGKTFGPQQHNVSPGGPGDTPFVVLNVRRQALTHICVRRRALLCTLCQSKASIFTLRGASSRPRTATSAAGSTPHLHVPHR